MPKQNSSCKAKNCPLHPQDILSQIELIKPVPISSFWNLDIDSENLSQT